MTYAAFVTQLRAQSGDTKRRIHVEWTGNSSDTAFQMPEDTFPVLDDTSTYTVKVNSVVKIETTDYTLDKTTGTLVLATAAPNGQTVEVDSVAVYLLDADWIQIINDVIRSLGDDFFKEDVDISSKTTTANMLSVTAPTSYIAVYGFDHRVSTSDDWQPVEEFTNWRYDRDNNTVYIGNRTAFANASELLRFRGLKSYTISTTAADSIDVQDQYFTILEYGGMGRYWRWRYKDVVEMVSKASMESSRTPLQELIMLSDRFDRLYETEKRKLKPAKPPRFIPQFKEGGGRP